MSELAQRLLYWVVESGLATLGNHLWQSTLFAVPVILLALLLRGNAARVRYMLWAAASVKFLVPFALLAALGTQISWHPEVGRSATHMPAVLEVAGQFVAPVERSRVYPPQWPRTSAADRSALLIIGLAIAWAAGAIVVGGRWWWRLRSLRQTVRAALPSTGVDFPVPVRVTARHIEPGIVGIFRPVLLLPEGMAEQLTPAQMRAVLAHELCHLRRRDNLVAALHMLVETVFWFHPLVWWIGARLIDERERACDEQVLREGHAPASYAEAILRVCEHYVASRLPCVSGVSGSDLRQRIQNIASNPLIAQLGRSKRLLLVVVAGLAVAAPIAAGIVSWRAVQGRAAYRDALFQSLKPRQTTMCEAPDAQFIAEQRELARIASRLQAGDGDRVLFYAVLGNSAADVRRLLASGAQRASNGFLMERSPVHVAARMADVPVLEVLAESGFALDGLDSSLGGSEASYAETPLMLAIMAGRMQNVDWLIRRGVDVNATNPAGNSALVHALLCRNQALVARLIEAGAVPDEKARRIARNLRFNLGPATAESAAAPPVTPLTSRAASTRAATPAAGAKADAGSSLVNFPPLTEGQFQSRWPPLTSAALAGQDWRNQSPGRFAEVMADFDGDGREDRALLRVAADSLSEGLFVKLSSVKPDAWQPVGYVGHLVPGEVALGMGVRMVSPGVHRTACGKGHWTCGVDEPAEVTLRRPGIEFFRPESASSLVYWDEAVRRLRRVWISD